jgi:hypothetical protein
VALALASFGAWTPCSSLSLSSFSRFHGTSLQQVPNVPARTTSAYLTMRKQKASDRRTRRMQRGGEEATEEVILKTLRQTITKSPMELAEWGYKQRGVAPIKEKTSGRGRSRKRATLYNSLSSYHNKFLQLLTTEYQAEVRFFCNSSIGANWKMTLGLKIREKICPRIFRKNNGATCTTLQCRKFNMRKLTCFFFLSLFLKEDEVLGRIKASIDDPLGLETAGHAVHDLYPERRGNLFSDEVYRLVKAKDATSFYQLDDEELENPATMQRYLPPNHKFSNNDVILLSLQPQGSGDFFDPYNLPTSSTAVSIEGRVISTGPTYIDVALSGGAFEAAFGPAPNNVGPSGRGDANLRLRADRFFSDIPYTRMVGALTQLTAIPDRSKEPSSDGLQNNEVDPQQANPYGNICMDDILKETIISTHAFADPLSQLYHDVDACDLQHLVRL